MVEIEKLETDEHYAYVCIEGTSPDGSWYSLDIGIRFDDSGINVDVFDNHGQLDPMSSIWLPYGELMEGGDEKVS